MIWRCMRDGEGYYEDVEATGPVEAAEELVCRAWRTDEYDIRHGDTVRVIVLMPEADAGDDDDDRFYVVNVSVYVTITAHGALVPRKEVPE